MMIAFVWLGMVALAVMQLPSLIHRRQWGELMAFGGMWLLAGIYASLIVSDMRFINAFEVMELVFTWFYGLLGLEF